MALPAEAIAALVAIVGRQAARVAGELAAVDPGVDAHNLGADLMLRPADTAELSRVLRYCDAARIPVVPQGGRSGISGGAVSQPGQVIVSLERINRIESFDPVSRTAVVGAGVTLAALGQQASEHGLSPGIDFGARDTATIGGMIATNAGGMAAFRHGTMRDRVLGLEVVLADGRVLTELGEVRKRNEGYALEQLFIGAEGTLGVISRAALALVAEDGGVATALVGLRSLAAGVAFCDALLKAAALNATAVELMSGNHAATVTRALGIGGFEALCAAPYLLLVEASGPDAAAAEAALVAQLEAALESGQIHDAAVAQNETQRRAVWRIREDWAVDREWPGGLWYDVSVPFARLPAYLESFAQRLARHDAALSLYVVGHLADGNVHLTVNAREPITDRYEEIALLVTEGLAGCGGSYSAEHGIGLEKRATLQRLASPLKLELMRRCKALLDPHNIMNPGKVLAAVAALA
jgi:FAD/FMN-containing dehydrogenase